jgi:hypothetical protein
MKYSLDGKVQAVIINKDIAQNYESNLVEMNNFTNIVQSLYFSGWFRKSLTTWNPGFGPIAFGKDVWGSYKNLPGKNPLRTIESLIMTARDAYIDVALKQSTMLTHFAYKNNLLIPDISYDAGSELDYETELERQTWVHGLIADKHPNRNIFLRTLKKTGDTVEAWNLFFERWSKLAGTYRMINEGYFEREGMQASQRIRTQAGTPDALAGGKWRRPMNGIFLFSNIGIQGLEATYRAAKEQKLSYLFKVAAVDVAPKLLMRGFQMGLAGWLFGLDEEDDWLKRFYNAVPDRDMANYTIIPLGFRKDGTPVYIPLPSDHVGMFFGGLAWGVTRPLVDENIDMSEIGRTFVNQSPIKPDGLTLPPALALDLMLLATGVSPYDTWRGTPAISRGAMDAGVVAPAMRGEIPPAVKEIALYEAQKYFSTVFVFNSDAAKDDMFNEIGRMPVVGPILRRYVRASDKGIEQRMRREKSSILAEQAATSEQIGGIITKQIKAAGRGGDRIDAWREVNRQVREGKLLYDGHNWRTMTGLVQRRFNHAWTMTYGTPEEKLKATTSKAVRREMTTDN